MVRVIVTSILLMPSLLWAHDRLEPAHQRLHEIGWDDPGQQHRQELLVADNVPEYMISLYNNIRKSLNSVVGGYPNYIHIIYNDNDIYHGNESITKRLGELRYRDSDSGLRDASNPYTFSPEDLENSRLDGADPGGRRTPNTNPYSICLDTLSFTEYAWEDGPLWMIQLQLALGYVHEYFHHYQRVLTFEMGLNYDPESGSVGAPWWWI